MQSYSWHRQIRTKNSELSNLQVRLNNVYSLLDRDRHYANITFIPAKGITELRNYVFKYFVYTYSEDSRRSHTNIIKLNLTAKTRIQCIKIASAVPSLGISIWYLWLNIRLNNTPHPMCTHLLVRGVRLLAHRPLWSSLPAEPSASTLVPADPVLVSWLSSLCADAFGKRLKNEKHNDNK